MESKNNIALHKKSNNIVPSGLITYNIINKKDLNKKIFFCFIIDQNYKDKIEISLSHENDIIKPNSQIVKSYDFLEKKSLFKNLKRFLYFYELEIPNKFDEIDIMIKYKVNNNFQGKYIKKQLSSLIDIDISPIYIELDKKSITYKITTPEEQKTILGSFIDYFSFKEISLKKEFLNKLFHNEKELYIKNIFLLSKLFDNNYNSLYDKVNIIINYLNYHEIGYYNLPKSEEIMSLYKNIKDSKSKKLLYFLIVNLLKKYEDEKALNIISRIKEDKIKFKIMEILFHYIIDLIDNEANLIILSSIGTPYYAGGISKDVLNFYFGFLRKLVRLYYAHIKEKIKTLENEKDEKISFLSKDNYLNYTIEIQLKEIFIKRKEDKRKKELERLNIELETKINKLKEELKEAQNRLDKNKIESIDKIEVEEKTKFINNNLICVTFISLDENINYSVISQRNDAFQILENKLYKKYPEYSKIENTFLLNGNKINRFQSLQENKICGNDIIVFHSSLL